MLERGEPRHTGSFTEYRLSNLLAGLHYLAADHFSFVKAIGEAKRQEQQREPFLALVLRPRELVRSRLRAPLVVLYSWPDASDDSALMALPGRLQARGVDLIKVNAITAGFPAS